MNIMLDLETLSSRHDAAIVAIGACTFDKYIEGWDMCRATFYIPVIPASSQALGFHVDAKTVQWWVKQSDEARAVLNDPEAVPLVEALEKFASFCHANGPAVVWGNGATFDNVILRNAYDRAGIAAPWSYRNDMCYRTLKNLRPDISFEPHGTAHNALDDAVAQARHAEHILAAMNNQG